MHQMLHQDITKKLENNYFHMILVGSNLNNYQTKHGRLKKYTKINPELLEIDIAQLPLE
jgi:hypothetical protein